MGNIERQGYTYLSVFQTTPRGNAHFLFYFALITAEQDCGTETRLKQSDHTHILCLMKVQDQQNRAMLLKQCEDTSVPLSYHAVLSAIARRLPADAIIVNEGANTMDLYPLLVVVICNGQIRVSMSVSVCVSVSVSVSVSGVQSVLMSPYPRPDIFQDLHYCLHVVHGNREQTLEGLKYVGHEH